MKNKSHYEFIENSNYQNIVVQFNNGLMAAFVEHYCTNPACPCVNVNLQFYEVNESGNFKEQLFSFALNTQTWEISEIKIRNANVAYEGLIKEFVGDLDPSLKERFRIRLINAKEYGKDEVVNWFDDLNVEDGWCFGYSEVYGEQDTNSFLFKYMNREYFVDDQYCANPKCNCNEAVLSFINIVPDRDLQEAQFALRVPLGKGAYEIENSNNIGRNEIEQIYNCYMEHIHDKGLLRNRYQKMKEFGKKRIQRRKQKQDKSKATIVNVGRNDPCPCGSGKKYKKCCG